MQDVMPTVAIFVSEGDLGGCAQYAIKHALSDPALNVRAIARNAADIGVVDGHEVLDLDDRRHPRLTTHIIPYDTASPFATAQLTAVLDGADAVIAAPSSRQAFKERKAASSMRAICGAMASRHVTAKRLVYVSTVGVDAPPMPWSAGGAKLASALAVGRAIRPDFHAADTCVRSSGLAYTIVRPVGLDAAAPRGTWKVLSAADRVGPLEADISKQDVGQFLLEEALRPPRPGGRDVQLGWAPRSRSRAATRTAPVALGAPAARQHAATAQRAQETRHATATGRFHLTRSGVAEKAAALRSSVVHAGEKLHLPKLHDDKAHQPPRREQPVMLVPEERRRRTERVPLVIIK